MRLKLPAVRLERRIPPAFRDRIPAALIVSNVKTCPNRDCPGGWYSVGS